MNTNTQQQTVGNGRENAAYSDRGDYAILPRRHMTTPSRTRGMALDGMSRRVSAVPTKKVDVTSQKPVPVATPHVTSVSAPAPVLAVKAPTVSPGQPSKNTSSFDTLFSFDVPSYTTPIVRAATVVVRRKRAWLRTALRVSAVTVSVLVLAGGVLFWRGYTSFHKVFRGTTTVAALSAGGAAPELLNGEGDGRVNILLLGIGGGDHPGADLTDTIMVLSVDPANNTAALLSVPRDLWVKMPTPYFGAYQKLNAAYSSGKYQYLGKADTANTNARAVDAGFAAVDQTVSEVLGLTIHYHALVNFTAFEQAIDTVQGVTVDVKTPLNDPTMAWENGGNPVLAAAGLQTMKGKQALMYARSRETTSDFARGERQRELLIALKQKVLTLGTLSSPTKIDSLMRAFGTNVYTDLSPQAATRLLSIMRGSTDSDITSLSLTTPTDLITTDKVGDASVVRPRAGFNTYSGIQTYVRSQLKDGYLLKEHARVYVVGATDELRQRAKDTLSTYGYTVGDSAVIPEVPSGMSIIDLSHGAAPYTLHYLQERYNVAATPTVPPGLQVPTDVQFAIISGR